MKMLGCLRLEEMKNEALGKEYKLSLVIADDKLIRKLNREYREKDKTTDILSFPLEKNQGEIFLNLKKCKIKAKEFDRTFENYVAFVFIHGLIHLKGMSHGSKMESKEIKIRKKFGV